MQLWILYPDSSCKILGGSCCHANSVLASGWGTRPVSCALCRLSCVCVSIVAPLLDFRRWTDRDYPPHWQSTVSHSIRCNLPRVPFACLFPNKILLMVCTFRYSHGWSSTLCILCLQPFLVNTACWPMHPRTKQYAGMKCLKGLWWVGFINRYAFLLPLKST